MPGARRGPSATDASEPRGRAPNESTRPQLCPHARARRTRSALSLGASGSVIGARARDTAAQANRLRTKIVRIAVRNIVQVSDAVLAAQAFDRLHTALEFRLRD